MSENDLLERLRCNIPPLPELQDAIEILAVDAPGRVRFRIDVPQSLGNYRSGIHGGTLYMIGEIGCGCATYSLGQENVCSSANINFFKAVPCGVLEVETEALHAGRSTGVIRMTSRDAATGKLVAQSTHNMFFFGPIEPPVVVPESGLVSDAIEHQPSE